MAVDKFEVGKKYTNYFSKYIYTCIATEDNNNGQAIMMSWGSDVSRRDDRFIVYDPCLWTLVEDKLQVTNTGCSDSGSIFTTPGTITATSCMGGSQILSNKIYNFSNIKPKILSLNNWESDEKLYGEKAMELKDMKKENLKEAKKQFDEERMNAEIQSAKTQLRNATDAVNRIDAQIKILEESKKPHLEVLAKFK